MLKYRNEFIFFHAKIVFVSVVVMVSPNTKSRVLLPVLIAAIAYSIRHTHHTLSTYKKIEFYL